MQVILSVIWFGKSALLWFLENIGNICHRTVLLRTWFLTWLEIIIIKPIQNLNHPDCVSGYYLISDIFIKQPLLLKRIKWHNIVITKIQNSFYNVWGSDFIWNYGIILNHKFKYLLLWIKINYPKLLMFFPFW